MNPPRVRKAAVAQLAPFPAPQQQAPSATWNFGLPFQGSLLKILLSDGFFARPLVQHIKPQFFQSNAMSWAWAIALQYREKYGSLPSFALIIDRIATLEPSYQALFTQVLVSVRDTPITDEQWLREQTLDFIKRNLFRAAYQDSKDLFQLGKVDEAYDMMQAQMDQLRSVNWDHADRGWLAEDFRDRVSQRANQKTGQLIGTGIAQLDHLLGGGAYPGFLGTWLAFPKSGKSTFLVNIGATAVRAYFRKVLHVVLEGSRSIVEARYDTIFLDEMYTQTKAGEVDARKYATASREMEYMRGLCVIRGFTKSWDTNILHIDEELQELHRIGFDPEVIVCDYADLLRARPEKMAKSETQEQVWAYKDLKAVANRGYRVWTASQVQRPNTDDWDIEPSILKSKSIADAYAKVRICDLIGSINMTLAERQQKRMRLHVELLRDGASGDTFEVGADFSKMLMGQQLDASPTVPRVDASYALKSLGYQGPPPFPMNGTAPLQMAQMKSGV